MVENCYHSLTGSEPAATDDETTWVLPWGHRRLRLVVPLALGIPFLIYGGNTLFFFLYTWPFFLALMPVAVVVGVALHSLFNGKLLYSTLITIATVVVIFGLLFLWLMG
ncbi:MAG: DUF3561 family protein [Enterobacter sp.]